MNTVARFQTPEDAHLFRLFLDQHGIEAFVFDEFTVQASWKLTIAIGGVRVVVHPDDVPEAVQYYQQYWTEVLVDSRHTPPARAWPFILLLSLYVGLLPCLIFGRHPLPEEEDLEET